MIVQRQQLEEQILSINSQLKELPKGNFFCTRNGKHYKWYQSDGHNQTYIPKKEHKLAEQLAVKKYLSLLLEDLIHEKKAIDFYLRHHNSEVGKAEQLLRNEPEYQRLLSAYFKPMSEALIDMLLYTNKVPFRYECALQLGETIIYPDFTIRHPVSGEVYYWEHFGKMDNPDYCKNVSSKLQLYTSHGIIPSIQLITTYETKRNPLSAETIEKIIREYFY